MQSTKKCCKAVFPSWIPLVPMTLGVVGFLLLLFLKVLPEEMIKDTCGVESLTVTDNMCSQRTACRCEMCGTFTDCGALEASNTTGLCCGGKMNCEQKKQGVQDTVCTAAIGHCYSVTLVYSLNGGLYSKHIRCDLDDSSCKTFLESTLVGNDFFTCWHKRKNDDEIYLKSQNQSGDFIGGVFVMVICALEVICSLIAPHLDNKFNKCRDCGGCGRGFGAWGWCGWGGRNNRDSAVEMTPPTAPPTDFTYPQRESPSTSTSNLSTVDIRVDASDNV